MLLLALAVIVGMPACDSDGGDDDDTTASDGDDDDVTDDDDSASGDDDDDSAGDDDDSTVDDDDSSDDDDSTGDDDDSTAPTTCAGWSDAAILSVVYNGPKVPAGYFVDSYPSNEFPQWGSTGCSTSLANTQGVASSLFTTGTLTGATRTTTEFYEVDVDVGMNTVHFREHRCDYWDGSTLGGTFPLSWLELQWLAGYLWYSDNHNIGGHHILGGFGNIGSATDWFDLCHVTTVYGDFGLCDEITLWSTGHGVLQFQGDVTFSPPVNHRTLEGNCN